MKAVSAVITSATITGLGVTSAAITTLTGTTLGYASASITTITGTTIGTTASATIRGVSGVIAQFNATSATITTLTSTSATITGLSSTSAALGKFTAGSSAVSNFLASGTITALGNISTSGNLSASGSITASSGSITTLTGTTLGYASASITTLTSASATITNLIATTGTITDLRSPTASATVLRSASATITNLLATSLAVSGVAIFAAGTAAAPAITTTGDTNTGIFFPAADTIAFTEGGVESMRIDSSGNVGIGTSSPAFALGSGLQVGRAGIATLRLENTSDSNSLEIAADSTTNGIRFYGINNAPFVFAPNATERMRLDTSGNLGIGTSTPSGKLDVQSSVGSIPGFGNTTSRLLSTATAGVDVGPSIVFGGKTNNSTADYAFAGLQGVKESATAGSYAGSLLFFTQNSGGSSFMDERMRLTSVGNLGIGTSSPNTRLEVANSATGLPIVRLSGFNSADNSAFSTIQFYNEDASQQGPNIAASIKALTAANTDGSGGQLSFSTSTGTASEGQEAVERARITSGGYSKFSNSGSYDDATGAYHELRQTANSTGVLCSNTVASFTGSNIISGIYGTVAGTGFRHFDCLNSAAASVFFVRGDGNAYNTNGTYGTISDQRLKQDIADAPSQWNDIKAIQFRKYRMKADVEANPDAPELLGVVAQELEQTSPGLVDEGSDGIKSVKSSILLMKAAVALQEAMARIEQLEAKVAALESK